MAGQAEVEIVSGATSVNATTAAPINFARHSLSLTALSRRSYALCPQSARSTSLGGEKRPNTAIAPRTRVWCVTGLLPMGSPIGKRPGRQGSHPGSASAGR